MSVKHLNKVIHFKLPILEVTLHSKLELIFDL